MRDYRQKLLNLCVALTTQHSDRPFHGNLSTSVKTRQPLSTLDILTIYRTNNSTEQITRAALVEATKKKANPATDEVRMENRNHGLARSQSGNNRTVASLLSLFKSYHQGRNYALQSKDSHYLQKNKRQLKFMSSHD